MVGARGPSFLISYDAEISTNWPEERLQEKRSNFDRSKLPSAPRASTAAEIDMSRLPSKPPYTVYLGNLSYECSEDDIHQLFERKHLRVRCSEGCCDTVAMVMYL